MFSHQDQDCGCQDNDIQILGLCYYKNVSILLCGMRIHPCLKERVQLITWCAFIPNLQSSYNLVRLFSIIHWHKE